MTDLAQHRAHFIVTRALDDEIDHRGVVQITETLAVFLEHRIAEHLRAILPPTAEKRWDA